MIKTEQNMTGNTNCFIMWRRASGRLLVALYAICSMCLAVSCTTQEPDFYAGSKFDLTVVAQYPSGFESEDPLNVKVEDVNLGYAYQKESSEEGIAVFTLPTGMYRISISGQSGDYIFNGTADKVELTSSKIMPVELKKSKSGTIVIKEIYCGGCKKTPAEGTYQADQYVILHNNDSKVQYLDSLCFGVISPANAIANNPWIEKDPVTGEIKYQDFIPVLQAVWRFPGSGSDYPLQPGEDAVLSITGAIDHSAQYPLSVNLNKAEYFVCYNSTYFTNTSYHPAPGNLIRNDHILEVVIKTGQANAYTMSVNSPGVLIFRSRGISIDDYVKRSEAIKQTPGDSHNPVVALPFDWVIDAVEVFNGSSTNNTKRFTSEIDAGSVTLSQTHLGHSLIRYVNTEATLSEGYEILVDTNNSTTDLYETTKQSLHE